MSSYQTNIENFNKKIIYYLEEIKTEELRREDRYNFVNSVKERGIIHCATYEQSNLRELIFISLVGCSKTIEDKLKILTNN